MTQRSPTPLEETAQGSSCLTTVGFSHRSTGKEEPHGHPLAAENGSRATRRRGEMVVMLQNPRPWAASQPLLVRAASFTIDRSLESFGVLHVLHV